MRTKDFKNISDVRRLIENDKNEIDDLKRDLKEHNKGNFKRFILSTSSENSKHKLERTQLKTNINGNKEEIKFLESYLKLRCKANYDKVVNLIKQLISLYEGNTYVTNQLDLEEKNGIIMVGNVPADLLGMDVNHICVTLVTTPDQMSRIFSLKKQGVIKNKDDIESALTTDKYIILEKEEVIDVVDYKTEEVNSDLIRNFPFLERLLKELVDFKVANATIDDDDAVNHILEIAPIIIEEYKKDNYANIKKYNY